MADDVARVVARFGVLQPDEQAAFRTIVPTAGNSTLRIPFMTLNSNTIESGPMAFWDAHAAWFYRGLSRLKMKQPRRERP